jgi:hypothetical protein
MFMGGVYRKRSRLSGLMPIHDAVDHSDGNVVQLGHRVFSSMGEIRIRRANGRDVCPRVCSVPIRDRGTCKIR